MKITVNGCFDLLHIGHIRLLRAAKALGGTVIVGLNSDASVRAKKGFSRPFIPQEQRKEMLEALECVDFVHIFDEPTPMTFLDVVKPDIHVMGGEYRDCVEEVRLVQKNGGMVMFVDRDSVSTTAIADKIRGSK